MTINFVPDFVEDIVYGRKRHTLRLPRTRCPFKVGCKLHLYTGMRTKSCKLIMETTCTDIDQVIVSLTDIQINGLLLRDPDAFAVKDGLESFDALLQFLLARYGDFRKNGFIKMELIHWKYAQVHANLVYQLEMAGM